MIHASFTVLGIAAVRYAGVTQQTGAMRTSELVGRSGPAAHKFISSKLFHDQWGEKKIFERVFSAGGTRFLVVAEPNFRFLGLTTVSLRRNVQQRARCYIIISLTTNNYIHNVTRSR